jgi:hypothetical protein
MMRMHSASTWPIPSTVMSRPPGQPRSGWWVVFWTWATSGKAAGRATATSAATIAKRRGAGMARRSGRRSARRHSPTRKVTHAPPILFTYSAV